MLPAFTKMSIVLESPKTCKEFENRAGQKWAREIIIDYYTRTEEGWLLGPLVKMLSVIAKENPTPGGLSRSYCLEVFYKIGEKMIQEHWFVKIPKSLLTVAMDQRELVMYNTIFPRLQLFLSETVYDDEKVDLPIPIIYFSSFLGDGIHDCLVTENLCASRYFQVDKDTTRLAYMRAAMASLANIHGITFAFMKSLGGKEALLAEFPTIKEQLLPRNKRLQRAAQSLLLPYLTYMSKIKPDISQQLQVLAKFYKFLYKVYGDLQNNDELRLLKTLVHGDAKLDNFLFKNESRGNSEDERYSAMIIDWQGCGFDLVSNDLMWCLYGFIKNLPETGEMIHGFVEYSLVYYWDELKKVLKVFGCTCEDFGIPENSDWAAELIKEGFTLEFLKNAVIRPVLSLKNTDLLLDWFKRLSNGEEDLALPPETEVFKSDTYANFIYLFFKIGTEVNVFSHLGKVLFTHMKEAMFSDQDPFAGVDEEDDDDDDEDNDDAKNDENSKNEENGDKEETEEEGKPAENGHTDPDQSNPEDVQAQEESSTENPPKSESEILSEEVNNLLIGLDRSLEAAKVLSQMVPNSDKFKSCDIVKDSVEQARKAITELTAQLNLVSPPTTVTSMYGKKYTLHKT